jgi:hypothetical protein
MCVARFLLALMLFVAPVALLAQPRNEDGKNVRNSPKLLAAYLTEGLNTDKAKVQSIFHWITDNIEYKLKPGYFYRKGKEIKEDADTGLLKPLNERVAEQVLQDGVGICDGYARLFSTLCTYAGIRSEVITGYARLSNDKSSARFRSNHSWNAVYFDSAWHLVDATWASGYIAYGTDRFVKEYNGSYFLTSPQQFINTHYPEDIQWTLLPDPPTLREFDFGPFKPSGFSRNRIGTYLPAKGIIEAAVGDTLSFELQPHELAHSMRIVDSIAVDSLALSQVDWWLYPSTPNRVEGNRVTMNYVVPSAAVKWLHIVYNNSVVLQYKLHVREPLVAVNQ